MCVGRVANDRRRGTRCLLAAALAAALGCGESKERGPTPPVPPSPERTPIIVTQPASAVVTEGDPVRFSVTATGPDLGYQWRRDGTSLTGANGPVLVLTATRLQAGAYSVLVTNAEGRVVSDVAVLTVTPALPVITGQPDTRVVSVGEAATFRVVTAGPPATYQWLQDGVPIPGATSSTYTTPVALGTDSGRQFSVVATGARGAVTSERAALSVSWLQNLGFESLADDLNAARWSFTDTNMTVSYQTLAVAPPARGGQYALVNGSWAAVKQDAAWQSVDVPASATTATLEFVLGIGNKGFFGDSSSPTNTWRVVVEDTAGTELETLATRTDGDAQVGSDGNLVWVPTGPFDLSAHVGRTVRIAFRSTQADPRKDTVFAVDNVVLVAK